MYFYSTVLNAELLLVIEYCLFCSTATFTLVEDMNASSFTNLSTNTAAAAYTFTTQIMITGG